MSVSVRQLRLEDLRLDGGTQPRAELSAKRVAEYRDAMDGGAQFPPVVVFHDGSVNWLADGFHRHAAALQLEYVKLPAEVRQGTQRDAVLYSVGANTTHGQPRTNADKRRAVEKLLADAEWQQWSDREIARACVVGHPLVARMREQLSGTNSRCAQESAAETRKFERGGKTHEQTVRRRPRDTAKLAEKVCARVSGVFVKLPEAERPVMIGALRELLAQLEQSLTPHLENVS